MDEKKPRSEYLYGVTKGVVSQLQFTVDTGTGEINFGPNVGNTYSEISYERAKGPKVLSRVPQGGEFLTFSTDQALTKNYDFLCAVDTNTRQRDGKTLCVTGIITVSNTKVPGREGLHGFWKFDMPYCLVFTQPQAKPEAIGWIAAWETLRRYGKFTDAMRVGIIVDSDLNNISAFNQRNKPVFGSTFLPQNAQLVYATSDSGMENVVNKALATADSVSTQTFRAIEASPPPLIVSAVESPWFEGFDMIFPRNKIRTPP